MIPFRDDNPTRSTPFFTIGLIVVNVLVFAYQFYLDSIGEGNAFIAEYALTPYIVMTNLPAALPDFLTSMFMHGGLLHIAGNMVYLWVFGDNIEDSLGHGLYLVFYLICGLLADFAQLAINPYSQIPSLGASGAIAGVLGAYLVLHPRARVQTLVFMFRWIQVIHVPALFLLGFWFVLQLLPGFLSIGQDGGGVAYFAHIGGFVAGAVLMFLWAQIRGIPTFLNQIGQGGGNMGGGDWG
jgi:membrane associated rhomboid family serine protease